MDHRDQTGSARGRDSWMGYSARWRAPSIGRQASWPAFRHENIHSPRSSALCRQRATVACAGRAEEWGAAASSRLLPRRPTTHPPRLRFRSLGKKKKNRTWIQLWKRQDWLNRRPLYSWGFASAQILTIPSDSVTNQQAMEPGSVINSLYRWRNILPTLSFLICKLG